jgi:flagella basal body P-ring formation protein FlgA
MSATVGSRRVLVALSCAAAGLLLRGQPAGAWINNEAEAPVRAAIIDAVHARMGAAVDVTIGQLKIRETNGATLTAPIAAVPDVGARTGGFVRFVLYDGRAAAGTTKQPPRRVGAADAEIFVVAEQVQARHAIARGKAIDESDVDVVRGDVGRVPLKPMPTARLAIGARALRPIVAGDRLANAMIAAPALVKSGDEVHTIVRVGALEAHGTAVAAQTGSLGDEIRLVNSASRRSMRGRVIGTREVEVTH